MVAIESLKPMQALLLSPRLNLSNPIPGPRRIIKITIGEKTGVRTDPRSVELQLDGAVETDSQRVLACFTHWVVSLFKGSR